MINYVNFDDFYKTGVDKQISITYSGGTLTNTDLFLDGLQLVEGINPSEQLKFGSCEAAELRLKIGSENLTQPSLVGEELDVSMVLHNDTANPFHFGTYKVVSDAPDRLGYYREIVAYDALYEVLNKDFSAWYNAQTFPMTLKQFRDGFFAQAGITQETITLPNDTMTVTQTIAPETLSGKDIIFAICEINGQFGHLDRNGVFDYVELPTVHPGLYPADDIFPDDTLYPADETGTGVAGARVVNGYYESYYFDRITKLTIRKDDESVETTIGSGTNEYVIQNNFLLYDKSTADLNTIGTNAYNVINLAYYQPCDLEVVGNPCFEVGDAFNANCNGEMVRSVILERKLVGTQALRDTYSADGENNMLNSSNTLYSQMQKLSGTQHKLIVDDAKFYSELFDGQGNSIISQLSDEIQLYVKKGTSYNGMVINSTGIKCTGNGSFQVDMSNLFIDSAGNLEIKGKVTATSGYIGTVANGFSISSSSISNGMTSLSDTTHDGVYVGTDGIALGKGKFKVTSAGAITATSGKIGNFDLGTYSLLYDTLNVIWAKTDQGLELLEIGDGGFDQVTMQGAYIKIDTGLLQIDSGQGTEIIGGDVTLDIGDLTLTQGTLTTKDFVIPSLGTMKVHGRTYTPTQITYLDGNGQSQTKYFLCSN